MVATGDRVDERYEIGETRVDARMTGQSAFITVRYDPDELPTIGHECHDWTAAVTLTGICRTDDGSTNQCILSVSLTFPTLW